MPFAFRPATAADAPIVAELMLQSGVALLTYAYTTKDKTALAFLDYAFRSGKGFFGYQLTTVGVDGDKIIFSAGAYATKDYGRLIMETVRLTCAFYGWRGIWPILAKGMKIGKLYTTPPNHGVYVANACTDPLYRGQGIFSRWLDSVKNRPWATPLQYVILDVAMDNPRAKALYLRLGFQPVAEHPCPGDDPVAGVCRMHLALKN